MYSVRRRLMLGVWLTLAMVAALTASSLWAIWSYRQIVNDLDRTLNRVPRSCDLVVSLASLFEPLRFLAYPETEAGHFARQQEFAKRLGQVEEQVRQMWRQIEDLPPSPVAETKREFAKDRLLNIDRRVQGLRQLHEQLTDPNEAEATAALLLLQVSEIQTDAASFPPFGAGLMDLLEAARETYWASFIAVLISFGLVVALFAAFVKLGQRWIFQPWAKLLEGTSRVAQGRFEYRVQLDSNDEFADLAESFNHMTERFVETRDDLNRRAHELAEQLARQEPLAGLGFLAAGVAHEINNPLTAIGWTSESLLARLSTFTQSATPADRALAENYLRMIKSESARCQEITKKLLEFARSGDGQRSRNDMTSIVRDVIQLVRGMTKYRKCEIVFDRADPCWLDINGNEIKQVVLNLIANALDAMDSTSASGTRRVRLASPGSTTSEVEPPSAEPSDSTIAGRLDIRVIEFVDHIEFEFQDSGCGMSPESLRKIFEPFYTTKAVGQGTGLGLSISHRLVSDHGGRLTATSLGPGQGSTFRLSLPRTAAQAAAA